MNERIANLDQAEEWNAAEGLHFVEHQERYDRMVQRLTPHLLAAASIAADDRVLDVGCGCGETSRAAARLARRGEVLGLDLSGPMLALARRLAEAEGLTNVRFEQGDAQVHLLGEGVFHIALSRNGVMFFADPGAAFANIARALRDRGRLAFLCWQDALENEFITVPGAAALEHVPVPDFGGEGPGPFSLADPRRIHEILRAAGFRDVDVRGVREPMLIGSDPDDVVQFIRGTGLARGLLEKVDDHAAERATKAIWEALVPYQRPDGVWLGSASWLVTARR